jgi:hypothetical protein
MDTVLGAREHYSFHVLEFFVRGELEVISFVVRPFISWVEQLPNEEEFIELLDMLSIIGQYDSVVCMSKGFLLLVI